MYAKGLYTDADYEEREDFEGTIFLIHGIDTIKELLIEIEAVDCKAHWAEISFVTCHNIQKKKTELCVGSLLPLENDYQLTVIIKSSSLANSQLWMTYEISWHYHES